MSRTSELHYEDIFTPLANTDDYLNATVVSLLTALLFHFLPAPHASRHAVRVNGTFSKTSLNAVAPPRRFLVLLIAPSVTQFLTTRLLLRRFIAARRAKSPPGLWKSPAPTVPPPAPPRGRIPERRRLHCSVSAPPAVRTTSPRVRPFGLV